MTNIGKEAAPITVEPVPERVPIPEPVPVRVPEPAGV